MSGILRIVAVAAAVVVVGAGAGLVWVAARGEEEAGAPRRGDDVFSYTADVRPRLHAFGDPVVAEVNVLLDPRVIRPDSVRLQSGFAPYALAAPAEVERSESGDLARIVFRYRLACLGEGCAAEGARRTVDFGLGRLAYGFRGQPGRSGAIVEWPSVQVASRVSEDDVASARWRIAAAELPPVSYRVSPGTLAAALLALSLALALGAAAFAWRLGRPAVAADPEIVPLLPSLSPLERALDLSLEASSNGTGPEGRRALERVARELSGLGLPDLADRARTLAWSPGSIAPGAVDELARDTRAAVRKPEES